MKKMLFSVLAIVGFSLVLTSCNKDITKNTADTKAIILEPKETNTSKQEGEGNVVTYKEEDFSDLFEILTALSTGEPEKAETKATKKTAEDLLNELNEYDDFLKSSIPKKQTGDINYDNFNAMKEKYESMSKSLESGLAQIESRIGARPTNEDFEKNKQYVDEKGKEISERVEAFWEKFGPIYDWLLNKTEEVGQKLKEEEENNG